MTAPQAVRWLCFAAVIAVCGWIVQSRLTLSYDLAYFLPEPVTESERVLIDRVGQGPGSRLLFVLLPGSGVAERDAVAERLAQLDGVRSVLPGSDLPDSARVPAPVLQHRYLLTDVDTTVDGLRRALEARLADLALVDDPAFLRLIAADPHLATLRVLERLGAGGTSHGYRLPDGTLYLMLETRPAAFDLGAQQALVAEVQRAVAGVVGRNPELYGAGAYGIRLQEAVQRESTRFSLAAAAALVVVLTVAYRNVRAVLLAGVPLLAGVAVGLATLAAAFPRVHGITLAFGFTLMGVTVDYGLHVLSHLRGSGRRALAGVWPTLALGASSTALAFCAFTLSGSRGLVQLGVFSVAGVVTAAFFAWFLLPHVGGATPGAADVPHVPARLRLRFWPLALCLAAGAGLLALGGKIWNDDLSSMTPVPEATLAVDRQLRQATGAPDIRYLVATRGGTSEASVLREVDVLEQTLEQARRQGLIADYRAVTDLVPAPATQARRRAALRPGDLPARIEQALSGLPFRADSFEPFVDAVRATAASTATVSAASYADTVLAGVVDGMLYRDRDHWVALTFLTGLDDPPALAARLQRLPASSLVDLQAASQSLLATYRIRLLEILAGAFVAIALIVGAGVRSWRRLCWIIGTLLATVLMTSALVTRFVGSLSLFDLVAVALVAGLGLDYALFASRRAGSAGELRSTVHAVTMCFASTAAVFGLLAFSGIPVLHGIGVTVTTGVVVAYVLALAGRRVSSG